MNDPLRNSTATSPTGIPRATDDHGLFVTITASLLLGSLAFFTALRLSIRYPFALLFGSDDAANVLSTICAVAQTTLVLLAVRKGLGQHEDDLDDDQKENVQQLVYSANILFVASLALSKVATSQLLERLTPRRPGILTSYATSAFALLWGSAFVLAVSITCKPSRPWELGTDRCSNWPQIWSSFGALGLFIEAVLVASPAVLLAEVKMPLSSKLTVITGFGFRLLLIPIEALRLVFLHRSIGSADLTYDLVPLVILGLFEQHYSILAGTIPCLCPTLDDTNAAIVNIRASQMVDSHWMSRSGMASGVLPDSTWPAGRVGVKSEPSLCRFNSASLAEVLPFEKEIGGPYGGHGFSSRRAPTVRSVDLLDAASIHQNGMASMSGSKERLASMAPSRAGSRERLSEMHSRRGSVGLVSRSGSKEQLASMSPSRTGSRERLSELCMRRSSVATVTASAEGPMSPTVESEGGGGKRRGSTRGSEPEVSDGNDKMMIRKKTDWNIRYSAADLETEGESSSPAGS